MIEPSVSLLIVLISLIFSAFFSGVEIAFVSADKLHIELRSEEGYVPDRILSKFLKKPSWFITTTLIGNNVSLVVYGIFMAYLLEPVIEGLLPASLSGEFTVFFIQTIIATLVVLITAEFIPKSIFLLNPNRLISFFAIPIYVIYIGMYPAVWIIVHLSKIFIERVLGREYEESEPVFGLIELNQYIRKMLDEREQEVQEKQEIDTKILENALEFKKIKVRDCLVPRTDLVTVSVDDTIDELRNAFIESGYSRILVYKDSIDNIIGFCTSIELFKKPSSIEDIIKPIMIVPETMLANELMVQFIEEHKNIALVVDEYGGTSGIVTMEDIIEEIFGDIQDEHDEEDLLEEKLDEDTYLLSARHEIDYLNDKYDFDLPEGDYETLGGLILSVTEYLPAKNEIINIGDLQIRIESIENNRIKNVRLTKTGE